MANELEKALALLAEVKDKADAVEIDIEKANNELLTLVRVDAPMVEAAVQAGTVDGSLRAKCQCFAYYRSHKLYRWGLDETITKIFTLLDRCLLEPEAAEKFSEGEKEGLKETRRALAKRLHALSDRIKEATVQYEQLDKRVPPGPVGTTPTPTPGPSTPAAVASPVVGGARPFTPPAASLGVGMGASLQPPTVASPQITQQLPQPQAGGWSQTVAQPAATDSGWGSNMKQEVKPEPAKTDGVPASSMGWSTTLTQEVKSEPVAGAGQGSSFGWSNTVTNTQAPVVQGTQAPPQVTFQSVSAQQQPANGVGGASGGAGEGGLASEQQQLLLHQHGQNVQMLAQLRQQHFMQQTALKQQQAQYGAGLDPEVAKQQAEVLVRQQQQQMEQYKAQLDQGLEAMRVQMLQAGPQAGQAGQQVWPQQQGQGAQQQQPLWQQQQQAAQQQAAQQQVAQQQAAQQQQQAPWQQQQQAAAQQQAQQQQAAWQQQQAAMQQQQVQQQQAAMQQQQVQQQQAAMQQQQAQQQQAAWQQQQSELQQQQQQQEQQRALWQQQQTQAAQQQQQQQITPELVEQEKQIVAHEQQALMAERQQLQQAYAQLQQMQIDPAMQQQAQQYAAQVQAFGTAHTAKANLWNQRYQRLQGLLQQPQ